MTEKGEAEGEAEEKRRVQSRRKAGSCGCDDGRCDGWRVSEKEGGRQSSGKERPMYPAAGSRSNNTDREYENRRDAL